MAPARKALLRILLACAGPLVFFGLLEGILFVTGRFEPPTVITTVTHQGRDYWTTVAEFGPFALRRPDAPRPHHLWLPVAKDPNSLRAVVLGESAVAGFPSEEYDLGRLTQAVWHEHFPERPLEVATVALVGVNSHTLRQMAIESLHMEPDVLVVYAGHNEVIGPYGPVSRLARGLPSRSIARLSMAVRHTRTGRALEHAIGVLGGRPQGRWTGLDEHEGSRLAADDPALDAMLRQTRENLRDIVAASRRQGCKVLVCVPAVNLTDWPPMGSAADADKSAQVAYERAERLCEAGSMDEAWEQYRRACDLDLFRFRADGRVRQLQRDLVTELAAPDVTLVDADRWLHEWNPTFPGDRAYFLEHVHLTFEGRVAVAALIADGIAALLGQASPPPRGDASAEIAAWWERFPKLVQAVQERLLFSEFDDAFMWQSVSEMLGMRVFRGMADVTARRRATAARAAELRATGRQRLTAADVESAWAVASALDPADGWIDLKAADTLAKLGASAAARKHLTAAREKYPRLVQVHTALVHQALYDRQPAAALGHLADLDALLPHGATPVELHAVTHLLSGNPASAVPYLEEMTRRSPTTAGAWLELAKAQAAAGRPRDALDSCRRGLARAGADPALTMFRDTLESRQRAP